MSRDFSAYSRHNRGGEINELASQGELLVAAPFDSHDFQRQIGNLDLIEEKFTIEISPTWWGEDEGGSFVSQH
jgi:hypothetical protein